MEGGGSSPNVSRGWFWMMAISSWIADSISLYVPRPIASFHDTFLLFWADAWRLISGRWRAVGVENCERPKQLLELYEYQACPNCAAVRETLSTLDIDHYVYPCPIESLSPKGTSCLNSRYRPFVKKSTTTGKVELPFLVDPNNSKKLQGSEEIVAYLWNTYGSKATPPANYRLMMHPTVRAITTAMSSLCRPSIHMGLLRAPSRKPEKPLELWGVGGSLFVRRVQEVLSTCELPYVHHVLPWRSEQKRREFAKIHADEISSTRKSMNFVKIPFLRDPNNGTELFESSVIIQYLQQKYQTAPTPQETWLDASAAAF